MLLSAAYAFWAMLGLKDGFIGLKARVFLEAVPGLGIVKPGIPIALFCLVYTLIEAGFYFKGSRNSEIVGLSILNGVVFGLIFRRFRPLVK